MKIMHAFDHSVHFLHDTNENLLQFWVRGKHICISSHLKFYHINRFIHNHIQIKSVAMETINSPFENVKLRSIVITLSSKVIWIRVQQQRTDRQAIIEPIFYFDRLLSVSSNFTHRFFYWNKRISERFTNWS